MSEHEATSLPSGSSLASAVLAYPGVFFSLLFRGASALFAVAAVRYVVGRVLSWGPASAESQLIAPSIAACLMLSIAVGCGIVLRAQAQKYGGFGVFGLILRVFRSLRGSDKGIAILLVVSFGMFLVAIVIP